MRHVVFDFGGVLMKHDKAGCLKDLRQLMPDDAITDILGFGNDKDDTLRARFETGACSTRYFLDHVRALCKPGTTEQQIIDAWNKLHAGIPDEAWETIRNLRAKGYRTYLMSNTDEIHWQHTLLLYRQQVETLFDGVFLSFELGMTKPSQAFFRHVADALDDGPTLFVDDVETNRLAARQFAGWQTCASIEELRRSFAVRTRWKALLVLFVLIIIGVTINEVFGKDLYVHTQEGATTDIFYVCSTETSDWINEQGDTVHFADMNKPGHRAALFSEIHGVDELVCPKNCNFYAPYYNQATIEGLLRDTALFSSRCTQATEEVIQAFDNYMQYKNQGRPFVLMGYSQGGYAVVELLKHLTAEQASRMVAAYVIGYQVTESDLQHPNIRAATSATDTGVTICYNSVASPHAEITVLSGKTVIGINPVNWCTDATPATYVFDYDDANDTLTATLDTVSHLTVIEGYDGACPMLPFVGKEGNYHCLEIPLYYRSLKHNIALRCEAKHGMRASED